MKLVLFVAAFLCLSAQFSFAQSQEVFRFKKSQLNFILQGNNGEEISCEHNLLGHVPWWRVTCGQRQFTVDTWIQIHYSGVAEMSKLTLMYHVSEGVQSSGQPLVQFNTHFTSIIVDSYTRINSLSSSLDVENGLGSLVVIAKSDLF